MSNENFAFSLAFSFIHIQVIMLYIEQYLGLNRAYNPQFNKLMIKALQPWIIVVVMTIYFWYCALCELCPNAWLTKIHMSNELAMELSKP